MNNFKDEPILILLKILQPRFLSELCNLRSSNLLIVYRTKITISLIVIGLKNSYFPLIHLPSCYWTVCYQTITFEVVV